MCRMNPTVGIEKDTNFIAPLLIFLHFIDFKDKYLSSKYLLQYFPIFNSLWCVPIIDVYNEAFHQVVGKAKDELLDEMEG